MLLAQANIALFRWPLDDPHMAAFVSRIDAMNQLSESSPGFVWRHADQYDPVGKMPPFDDPLLFFNMSVWNDVASLRDYVFHTDHIQMLRQKSKWTRSASTCPLALWWINVDARMPTVDDAMVRLSALESQANSVEVFTFANVCPAPHD